MSESEQKQYQFTKEDKKNALSFGEAVILMGVFPLALADVIIRDIVGRIKDRRQKSSRQQSPKN